MDVSFCAGDPDSHCYIAGTKRARRSNFGKLDFLLCLSHLK